MTVDGSNRYGLVLSFLHKYFAGGYSGSGASLENPLPTVTSWDHNSIVTANLIQMNNHCDGKISDSRFQRLRQEMGILEKSERFWSNIMVREPDRQ